MTLVIEVCDLFEYSGGDGISSGGRSPGRWPGETSNLPLYVGSLKIRDSRCRRHAAQAPPKSVGLTVCRYIADGFFRHGWRSTAWADVSRLLVSQRAPFILSCGGRHPVRSLALRVELSSIRRDVSVPRSKAGVPSASGLAPLGDVIGLSMSAVGFQFASEKIGNRLRLRFRQNRLEAVVRLCQQRFRVMGVSGGICEVSQHAGTACELWWDGFHPSAGAAGIVVQIIPPPLTLRQLEPLSRSCRLSTGAALGALALTPMAGSTPGSIRKRRLVKTRPF